MKTLCFLSGAAALLLAACSLPAAEPAPQARITLVEHNAAPGALSSADPSVARKEQPGQPMREAHRFVQTTQVGTSLTETVEVAFHAKTTLEKVEASNDFHVVSGGSCREGQIYNVGDRCTVDVAFKGTGPGKRAGQLLFSTGESAVPEVVGLQGTTLGPALAFTPAQINTLPQSMPQGSPLLYAPSDVAVDQGDNLYILDAWVGAPSASGEVYRLDSTGQLHGVAGGGSTETTGGTILPLIFGADAFLNDPTGLATDSWLDLFIAEYGHNAIDQYGLAWVWLFAGLGSNNHLSGCTAANPCPARSINFYQPFWVNTDANDNVFITDTAGYYSVSPGLSLVNLSNASGAAGLFPGSAFGLDSTEDFYASRGLPYSDLQECEIEGWHLGASLGWAVAGNYTCGYAGNNVRAQSAEIEYPSGYAFDAAGDMYFADPLNNVLRRVDSYNGLIRTVAGKFALGAGGAGDGGPATDATLNYPTGVAVDSNGVIYTASYIAGAHISVARDRRPQPESGALSSPTAVIRQIGPAGQRNFATTMLGKTSPVQTVLLTNVGNDDLNVSKQIMGGPNPGDFIADPATTSCTWTASLAPGQSCQLGYAFAPKAAGLRRAVVTFVDNTAAFQNTLYLNGAGISAPVTPTVTLTTSGNVTTIPYSPGLQLTFLATVANTIPIPTPPTGTVVFTLTNTTTNKIVSASSPDALTPGTGNSSTTSAIVPNLKAASYSLSAAYSGDAVDAAATSAPYLFTVTPLTPTINWPVPAAIATGTKLSSTQLDATASYNSAAVPGTFVYNPPAGTVMNTAGANTLKVTFTPSDNVDYTIATGSVQINVVVPKTPTINWPTPAAITKGTMLSATQLNATATYGRAAVPGTFAYNPPAGTAMNTLGENTLKVTFTPADAIGFTIATGSVQIDVTSKPSVRPGTITTLRSLKNPIQEGQAAALSVAVKPLTGRIVPAGAVTLREGGKTLATAKLSSGVASLSLTGLSAGTHVLTAEYTGDSGHGSSDSAPVKQIVVTVTGSSRHPVHE